MNHPTPLQHRKPIIGLTGGPGAGKSTVAGLFAELGCGVIDADRLAHEALQSDSVRDQLVRWWGPAALDDSGAVSRKAVGAIVFGDAEKLRKLESVVHPVVHAGRAEARARMLVDPSVAGIVEDCPLLLESGLDAGCDAVVFVDCPRPVRLQRLQASRGWDEAELQKRERHQRPLDIKRRTADYVISNDVPIERVKREVESAFQDLLDRPRPA